MSSESAPTSQEYSPRLLRYAGAVIAAAVPVIAGAVASLATHPPDASVVAGVVVFAIAAIAAELKPVPLDESGHRVVSLAFVFLLACQVLFGWESAVLVALLGDGDQRGERSRAGCAARSTRPRTRSRSSSPRCPARCSAGTRRDTIAHDFPRITLLVFLDGGVYVAVNVMLDRRRGARLPGRLVRAMIDDYVRHAGPAFAVMGFIAALATALWRLAPALEFLLAGPLFALAL